MERNKSYKKTLAIRWCIEINPLLKYCFFSRLFFVSRKHEIYFNQPVKNDFFKTLMTRSKWWWSWREILWLIFLTIIFLFHVLLDWWGFVFVEPLWQIRIFLGDLMWGWEGFQFKDCRLETFFLMRIFLEFGLSWFDHN